MNDHDTPRLREHPAQRFEGDEHLIDLNAAAAQLRAEHPRAHGHHQITVFKRPALTVSLFSLDAQTTLPQHKAGGIATILCLDGAMTVTTPSHTHHLTADMMVVLEPDVPHAVHAGEASRMLLSLCKAE